MQLSKEKVNHNLEKQLKSVFFQMIVDIDTTKDAETIFSDILSETEMVAIVKRLGVAYWLSKKRSYAVIKSSLKVSSATIASQQHELKKAGWQLTMKKIMADEWATRWEQRIKQLWKMPGATKLKIDRRSK